MMLGTVLMPISILLYLVIIDLAVSYFRRFKEMKTPFPLQLEKLYFYIIQPCARIQTKTLEGPPQPICSSGP